ncbi:TetR/AcrR family transcriptional regulator [Eubacterium sp. MSJ-13]|uniref:TetR/AcrR family transcriptional regulator n=1 Tax=Eubacterium sp. MSJ-13 TaxID=2841513 RepID=UPI001C10EF83|nr:TetR/AcrR family transcriptional regulator [Eubacterium sp. MSJ-13]MBU5477999.1 TetR/AcrR family transcriptional regulator [Eubacterium sp. MSJ-13]
MREVEEKRIIDAAFDVFVREKIEVTSMAKIAQAAGVGRATVFRHYPSKLDLVIAVNSAKWKEYLDELDRNRPISSLGGISAIDRFIFTMDSFIDMYINHKALLQFNDNFNHFVSHSGVDRKKLKGFNASLLSADTRFIKMYEKAKEDHTLRTDIPFEEFMRETVHVMMAVCTYYANGFVWGADENKDYIPELKRIKEMLISFAKNK